MGLSDISSLHIGTLPGPRGSQPCRTSWLLLSAGMSFLRNLSPASALGKGRSRQWVMSAPGVRSAQGEAFGSACHWLVKRAALCAILLLLPAGAASAVKTTADAPGASSGPRPYPKRLRWWTEGRFGLFIHWGPISLKEAEISWSRANSNPKCPNKGDIPVEVYDNLYHSFDPTNFNAAEWVRLAKAAGTKYMVLTAKHCDGFLLWHSQVSDYNIGNSPFQRDICVELARAARKQRVRIGWYFSPMDWRDPDFRTDRNALFLGRMQAELRELLSHCGRIDLLWFDWDGREALYDQPAHLRHRQGAAAPDHHQQPSRPWPHQQQHARSFPRRPITTRPSRASAPTTTSVRGNPA